MSPNAMKARVSALVFLLFALTAWSSVEADELPDDAHAEHGQAHSSEHDESHHDHNHDHDEHGHGHSMDTVTVVATRVGRSASDEPIRVEVIVREEIEMCGFGFRGIDRASNR